RSGRMPTRRSERCAGSSSKKVGRKEQDVLDSIHLKQSHQHPVQAYRHSSAWRQSRHGIQELFVERVRGAACAPTLRLLLDEPSALLIGLGQLRKAVRQFSPSSIELEALGHRWIVGLEPRQRRQGRRILDQKSGLARPKVPLDLVHEEVEDQILEA